MKNASMTFLFLLLISMTSCKKEKIEAEKIDFKLDYLLNSEIENNIETNVDTTGRMLSRFLSQYAMKGNYLTPLKVYDSIEPPKAIINKQFKIDSIKQLYEKIDAKKYIVEQSVNNQIIIINEDHHIPFHRTFTTSLLKDLYSNGFRHIGFEALNTSDSLLLKRGYPNKKSGYYLKEPEFGNMIRVASDIGFNVFGYEDIDAFQKGGKFREIAQAENIKKVIDANPNDKIIIHCGFGHASEGLNPYWEKAMARRLSESTSINPLTINQSRYTERSKNDFNNIFLQAFNFKSPSILIDKTKTPLSYNDYDEFMDVVIFHPNTEMINERPSWMFNNRKKVNLKISDLEIEYPIIVLAYDINDDVNDSPTPIDILDVKSKKDITLALKKGEFQIILSNGKESLRFEKKVE